MPGDIGLPGILPFLGYFSQISVGAEQISMKRSMRAAVRSHSEYVGYLYKSRARVNGVNRSLN